MTDQDQAHYVSPRDEYELFLNIKEASEYAATFGDDQAPQICQHIQTYLLYKFKRNQTHKLIGIVDRVKEKTEYLQWLCEKVGPTKDQYKYCKYEEELKNRF